tara:strand:+ start:2688 stop:3305 length:618 start_codon:yes stop_codon:yes gene_type:complete
MAYYLGRDVKVYIANESTDQTGFYVHDTTLAIQSAGTGATKFAGARGSPMDSACQVTDLTGVDLGIGATDEDISFMGLRTVLKAEVKKETTLSLTKKKSDAVWDVVFNGDDYGSIRWGGTGDLSASSDAKRYTGLEKPTQQYGYRLHIQLKSSGEIFCIRNAQIQAHTVSLNADGTTEETMEFISHVDPKIVTSAHGTLTPVTDL